MFIMSLHYHYITLHRYICDDIRAGSPWGRATDGILISDSDLIWISHSSLTPSPGHHNLLITEQSRKFLIHQSIQNMSSSKRSLLPVFTCKHRKDKLVFESELDYRRESRTRERDVIKIITLDRSTNYTQFTRRGQGSSMLQCYSVKALKMFPGHSLWPGIRWQSQSDIRSSSESGFTKIILTLQI